ncbi:MAG TPA: 2-C-methyl-D-erythritol 4-phosphate cytidylyltransferase [Thermodesulfobacteriota bacterium]|nr:2-C-methyl-D-erythritol 4-phosphate cytidylyltransferase [Deltaproteobacteria bacterium]HQO78536.1 2-C-methyl-D-erythritol 4-phosphate cytidylyltransferase [Thermodesulfobacteriota bacterium]
MEPSVDAIILAAGRGVRLGHEQAKAFVPVLGKPLLAWTLLIFESIVRIRSVVTVVPPGLEDLCRSEIVQAFHLVKTQVVAGGKERQDSLQSGFGLLPESCELVVVHDGARPLVTPLIVGHVLDAARKHGAALAAVPVKDTVKEAAQGMVERTLDRSRLWLAQTPQAYHYRILKEALEAARSTGITATDDAALVERLGKTVAVVSGSYENIKVTTPEDVWMAEYILRKRLEAGQT